MSDEEMCVRIWWWFLINTEFDVCGVRELRYTTCYKMIEEMYTHLVVASYKY